MKNILTHLKIFGLSFAIASSNAILLSGCTTKNNDNIYFEKYNDDSDENNITIDEVILNIDEKGLITKVETDKLHSNLVDNLLYDGGNKSLLSIQLLSFLNIEKYYQQALVSDAVTKKVSHHSNSLLYDTVNNDIYWDKLFEIVKKNNEKFISIQEEKDGNYNKYESFNDEEILMVIDCFHDFVDSVKKDIPDFDIETLACHLSDLSLCYENTTKESYNLAYTSYNGLITFPLYHDCYPDLNKMKDVLYHEFKHYISFPCSDEKRFSDFNLTCTGILNFENHYNYNPFYWKCLEEALAEDYSCFLMNNNPSTYTGFRYLFDTIEMVNSFSNSKEGSINEFSIKHNPIAILQQFLVLGNDSVEQELWLKQNLMMLECYNMDVNNYITYASYYEKKFNKSIIKNYSLNDKSSIVSEKEYNQCVYTFLEEANIQLLRLGVGGLAIMKDNSECCCTLDDLLYLLKLLEYRMNQYDLLVKKDFDLTLEHTDNYNEKYNTIINLYLDYLQESYNDDDIQKQYQEMDISSYELSNGFSNIKKEKISSLYEEITVAAYDNRDFYKQNRDILYKKLGYR